MIAINPNAGTQESPFPSGSANQPQAACPEAGYTEASDRLPADTL
jgi:hypothetical protein